MQRHDLGNKKVSRHKTINNKTKNNKPKFMLVLSTEAIQPLYSSIKFGL